MSDNCPNCGDNNCSNPWHGTIPKPPVAPQGTVEGETDADYVKAGEAVLAKHDHRWESHSDYVKGLIVRDVAYYRDLLVHAFAYSIGLERKLAESVAPPSVAMQRNSVLMEALKAVENERLDEHGELCASSDAASVYKEDNGDEAYSRAIRDAENAIKLLMSKPPIEVPPPSGVELAKQLLRVNLFTNMTPRNRQLLDEEVLAALDALPVAVSGEGSGVPALDPTFAYELAMYLTRNSQLGNAPEMQGEIEQFLRDKGSSPLPNEYEAGFNRCKELAEAIVDEHDGYLCQIGYLDPITSRILFPVSSPLQEGAAPPDTRHD